MERKFVTAISEAVAIMSDPSTDLVDNSVAFTRVLEVAEANHTSSFEPMNNQLIDCIVTVMRKHRDDVMLQRDGCRILGIFTNATSYYRLDVLVPRGGVESVIQASMAHPGARELQYMACFAFGNFSTTRVGIRLVLEEGGFQCLMRALDNFPEERFAILVCAATANIAMLPPYSDSRYPVIMAEGALPKVVDAMRRHPLCEAVQLFGCNVFCDFFAIYGKYFAEYVVNSGGTAAILTAMENHPKSSDIQFAGCHLFTSVSVVSQLDDVVRKQAVDRIYEAAVLDADNQKLVTTCFLALGVIGNQREMFEGCESEAMSAFAPMMDRETSALFHEHVIAVLLKLRPTHGFLACFLHSFLPRILATMDVNILYGQLQESACQLMSNLAVADETGMVANAMVDAGAVCCILAAMDTCTEPSLFEATCSAIASVCTSPMAATKIVSLQGVTRILNAMERDASVKLQGLGLGAIAKIVQARPTVPLVDLDEMLHDNLDRIRNVMDKHGSGDASIQATGCAILSCIQGLADGNKMELPLPARG